MQSSVKARFTPALRARSTADFCSSSASTIRALELLLRHCHVLSSATTHRLPRRVISSATAQRSPLLCPLERDCSSLPAIVPSQAQLFLFHLCHILSSVSIPYLFLVPTIFSQMRTQAPPQGPTMIMQQSRLHDLVDGTARIRERSRGSRRTKVTSLETT